jgi:hypothetical protein
VDEWVDGLLVGSGRVCAVVLPVIKGRGWLEDEDRLGERVSALGEELEELDRDGSEDEGEVEEVDGGRRGSDDDRSDHIRNDDSDMDEGD